MKWIARVLVFTTALVFGTFAASLFWNQTSGLSHCTFTVKPRQIAVVKTPIKTENLLGTWKGTWGHNDGECTLLIDRVKGNAFYGTLKKQGAVIRFEGTFDPNTRKFHFNETKILRLGPQMSEWSLGKNTGTISQDTRTLTGHGQDKWGHYTWAASNY